jgi:hypothetical protein
MLPWHNLNNCTHDLTFSCPHVAYIPQCCTFTMNKFAFANPFLLSLTFPFTSFGDHITKHTIWQLWAKSSGWYSLHASCVTLPRAQNPTAPLSFPITNKLLQLVPLPGTNWPSKHYLYLFIFVALFVCSVSGSCPQTLNS